MKYILNKTNLLIFPEGTWNLEMSLPMLPMYWGAIRLAQETGCPIIPFVEEDIDNQCYVNFGHPFSVLTGADKTVEIEMLRDVMATLRWTIWEQFSVKRRKEIKTDEWKIEKKRRLDEYLKLNWKVERKYIRKN